MKSKWTAAVVSALLLAPPAQALTRFDISLTDFGAPTKVLGTGYLDLQGYTGTGNENFYDGSGIVDLHIDVPLGGDPTANVNLTDAQVGTHFATTNGVPSYFSFNASSDSLHFYMIADDMFNYFLPGSYFYAVGAEGYATDGNINFVQEIPAVPEPEIWAMLITGFFAVGYMIRRRNTVKTFS